MTSPASALDGAIIKAGGPKALADILKVSRSAVWLWRKGRVPAERAIEVETVTGVSRHELRPDLWPAPTGSAATSAKGSGRQPEAFRALSSSVAGAAFHSPNVEEPPT